MARRHYENFPVASLLLPAAIRPSVAAIYAFARQADDIADEGTAPAAQRLVQLDDYDRQLMRLAQQQPVNDPVFIALSDTIRRHQLPLQLFHDLISAFRQDITVTRYHSDAEVLDYCRRSANPVGRLLLHLTGQASPENLRQSDLICSALQLINFLQDLAQDYDENNRIYLPLDLMQQYGVSETHFRNKLGDDALQHLMDDRIRYAQDLLLRGAPLAWRLPGRLGLEIRLTVFGGLRILQHKRRATMDAFSRPRLDTRDKIWIVAQALTRSQPEAKPET
ncbi:MAG: squalene synthase HpnC [Gammaproteobacteria bacterium]|nr:squalene synthase HpnC [Gammaproteobacteria bacterium]